ncbi:MAG: type I secretion C-terminal target domain-containing protein [Rhodospirillaceae bacterium]|nr:type I secretion C-terminal target domain-containing protein [Rhodospirillaceae bacterium]MBT3883519.1 type I secretion C-terminal target domain-containing protein [Rhodospirillaceae bacterium]MBT4118825.1 type I secretion C-terminal target domain-containing protein [Rhodospirillaceae bacterium]MBT4719983.1 type I secretion C-terminal target domain-containing protein [Rhodospirillaceae bacterium]MBT4751184.1 type I secretion C-terminal target domain-containing protein [Rhodospirillaceae bact
MADSSTDATPTEGDIEIKSEEPPEGSEEGAPETLDGEETETEDESGDETAEGEDVAEGDEDVDSGLELASGVTTLLSLDGDADGEAEAEEEAEDSDDADDTDDDGASDVAAAPDTPDVPDVPPAPARGRFEFSDAGEPGIDLGASRSDFGASFDAPSFEFTASSRGPSPSDFVTAADDKVIGDGSDEILDGSADTDVVFAKKGDDTVSGMDGDDWLRGGHGDDTLDGGAGSDVVDGEKGDDALEYTLSENIGAVDYYDGGKGNDTLRLTLTAEEYDELAEELDSLEAWMADTANTNNSAGHAFNDKSVNSDKHPTFETSFGLNIRNIENLEINVLEAEEPEEEPETDPSGGDSGPVVIDLAATSTETGTSEVGEIITSDGALSIESVSVTLYPDSIVNVSLDVEVSELPPVFDVFMVQDLSGSFYDDLPQVQTNLLELWDSLSADYDVQFGLGSFVDKPLANFGSSYYPDYTYNTDLAITDDREIFADTLDSLYTQSGADAPESQLEALVQVAVRGGDEIGFRDGAERFVVLSSDAPYHEAGDFAEALDMLLGYYGDAVYDMYPELVDPVANDYDSEVTSYDAATGTYSEIEDYPAVKVVGEMLAAANITPIFAIANWTGYNTTGLYQDLVDGWGFGYVTEISSDSSDLFGAITTGLTEAEISLDISIDSDDYGYVTSVTPESYADAGPGTYTFDLTLEMPEDSVDYSSDSITLNIDGYGSINFDVEIALIDAVGGEFDDTLLGSAASNTLSGMGGDDVLDGREGSDTLTGGIGSDTFAFTASDGSVDTITDFEIGTGGDVLDFSELISGFADGLAIGDFIKLVESGDATSVYVDADGGADDFSEVVVLDGITGADAEVMAEDGNLAMV